MWLRLRHQGCGALSGGDDARCYARVSAGFASRKLLSRVPRAGGAPKAPKGFGVLRTLLVSRGLDSRLRGKRGLEGRFQVRCAFVDRLLAAAGSVSLIGSRRSWRGFRSAPENHHHQQPPPLPTAMAGFGATRLDQSIAAARSNASSQSSVSEGTPLQFARDCAVVMACIIRPLRRGADNYFSS